VGAPREGDVDVPTDVVPFYDALAARLNIDDLGASGAEFTMTSSTGDVVRTSYAKSHVWTFDLTPERHLEPHATYTLRGTWNLMGSGAAPTSVEVALVFTTGDGPLAQMPPAPAARLQHYRFQNTARTSCSPSETGTCVSFASGLPVSVGHFIAGQDGGRFNPYDYLYQGPFFTDIAGVMQHTPFDCIELQTRAPNAKKSEPTVLCRGDGPLAILTGSETIACTAQGLTHDGGVVAPPPTGSSGDAGESGASCAIGSGRRGADARWGALVALAVLGLSRRVVRVRTR
jgi:hypothetical protein